MKSLKRQMARLISRKPPDLCFHDGTSYRSLLNALVFYCDELHIRHDIDDKSYIPMAGRMTSIEHEMGRDSTIFLFKNMIDKYGFLFKKIGLHRRFGEICPSSFGALDYSEHGDPDIYRFNDFQKSTFNWSYLNWCDVFISDSMGVWNCCIGPYDGFEHFLLVDNDRRVDLAHALVYCIQNRPRRVQLSIHPNPLTWRKI